MDWIVQNARNTDVERQHLNKILAEIRASIVKVEGEVRLAVNRDVQDIVGNMLSGEQTGIKVWYDATKSNLNFRVPNFTIRLTGDVIGTGTVSALTDVNIVTTLDSDVGIPDAPNTGDAFWRRSQEWEQVPVLIESLSSLPDNGLLVATDTGITNREIEGPMSVVVTDGDGVLANPSVSLVNDELAPGWLESYATNMDGTKGWYKPALFESTGLLSGGALAVNGGDNTKFDITAAVVGYTDYTVNPAAPTRYVLQVGPFSAVTVTDLSITATYIGIQMPGGTVVQQSSPYTATQTRTIVPLGAVISNGVNLIAVNNLPIVIRAGINQIQDFMAAIGPINISGNKITPDGVNLQLDKSAGVVFKQGANFNNDPFNPHGLSLAALNAFNFQYRLSDGTQFAATNAVDPNNYESPLGTLAPVTAANRFTIQRFTVFTSNLVRAQYGQFVYNTMAEAESALATESFVTETNIAENGILLAFLIVQDGATDLSDPTQAKFIPASKFGGPVGTGGTSILNTDALPEGLVNLYFTDLRAQSAVVIDSIADSDTTHAPSRNAVFDALATNSTNDRARANHTGTQLMATISDLPVLAAGTWTPTLTGTTNVTSTTAFSGQYSRVGNTVTASVRADAVCTNAGVNTVVSFTIPVASNFTLLSDGVGAGTASNNAGTVLNPCVVNADVAGDQLRISFLSLGAATNATIWVAFSYRVI